MAVQSAGSEGRFVALPRGLPSRSPANLSVRRLVKLAQDVRKPLRHESLLGWDVVIAILRGVCQQRLALFSLRNVCLAIVFLAKLLLLFWFLVLLLHPLIQVEHGRLRILLLLLQLHPQRMAVLLGPLARLGRLVRV